GERALVMSTAKSSTTREIGVGVIGLGWMGRVHAAAYAGAARSGQHCRLVAVSDKHAERLHGGGDAHGNLPVGAEPTQVFDPARVRAGADVSIVLAAPSRRRGSLFLTN